MPPEYVLQWLHPEVVGPLALLAAILWVVKMISKARAWARPRLERFDNFMHDWFGTPARPGLERTPGIPERMASLEDAVPGMTVGLREVQEKQAVQGDQLSANADAIVANVKAVAELAEAVAEIRHNVKPDSGTSAYDHMRDLMMEALAELAHLRGEFNTALQHNHPDYRPPAKHHPDDFAD